MLNIFLNIIGITLVLYSIFIIKKDISMKTRDVGNTIDKRYFKDEFDTMDLYQIEDEIVEDFDLLMDNKIQLSKIEDKKIDNKIKVQQSYEKAIPIIQDHKISSEEDNINPLHKKIMELESIGLSNEEIAKKMGRGVREIDIILKIYKKSL